MGDVDRRTPKDCLNLKPPPECMSKLYGAGVNRRTTKVLQGVKLTDHIRILGAYHGA
jgi:hypothetical protein